MYTMGQAATLPAPFGRIHPVHQTPTFAIAFAQTFGIVAILLGGLLLRPEYIFGFLETIATLAVIVLYCMANLALTSYIRREHRDNFSVWRHVVFPWIATLALLPVLFVTIYPVPTWPYNITPYLFLAALMAGFGYMQCSRRAIPEHFAEAQPCSLAAAALQRATWTGTGQKPHSSMNPTALPRICCCIARPMPSCVAFFKDVF